MIEENEEEKVTIVNNIQGEKEVEERESEDQRGKKKFIKRIRPKMYREGKKEERKNID